MKEKTLLVKGYSGTDRQTGAISFPIYQSATFAHPGLGESTGFDYSRVANPTRQELEKTIALLENGKQAWAFSSGMAAISSVVKLFKPGEHILVSSDLYGGTYRLFTDIYGCYGLEFEYVDTDDIAEIKKAIKPNTKGIFIETPSNPMMKVTDIKAVAELTRQIGALLIVDNTFLSPYFQKPLNFGADIVVHSATKYIGGHNDILAGLIIVSDDKLIEAITFIQKSEGGMLSPMESWLTLRSLKTLSVRLEKQQENAFRIVEFLKQNKQVSRVLYAGDPEHTGYEISKRQSSGFGAMISFHVKDPNSIANILKNIKVINFAESLGGVESLMTYPIAQTHQAIPVEMRERLGVTNDLLRLSVGIEDVEDLIEDLEKAFFIL